MRIRCPTTPSERTSACVSFSSEDTTRRLRDRERRYRQRQREEEQERNRARREREETRRERVRRAPNYTGTFADAPAPQRRAFTSHTEAKSLREKRAAAAAKREASTASILKSGLAYVFNNYVPIFGMPVDTSTLKPQGSFSTAPGAWPGEYTESVPPSSSPVGSDEEMTDESYSPTGSGSGSGGSSSPSSSSSSLGRDRSGEDSDDEHVYEPRSFPPQNNGRSNAYAGPHLTDAELTAAMRQRAKAVRAEKRKREEKAQKERREARQRAREEEAERARFAKQQAAEERRRAEEEKRRAEEQTRPQETDRERRIRENLELYEATRRSKRERLDSWLNKENAEQGRNQSAAEAQKAREEERQRRENLERERERRHNWEQERMREREKQREKARQEEEERKRHETFSSRPRERTSKTRSTHSRSHPYARSAKLGRSHSGLHFNPAPPRATTGKGKPSDPLVAHFESYEEQWKLIVSLKDQTHLYFSTIPWPLLIVPNSPADITPSRVREFVQHAKRPGAKGAATGLGVSGGATARNKELRMLAMRELKNWHSDKFTTRVLSRVWNEREREIVRSAADVVQKTLTELKSSVD